MELEKQACSLELAKKLKELGVKQDSVFVWAENPRDDLALFLADAKGLGDERYAAFTVAELGEMLRPHLQRSIWLSEAAGSMHEAAQMINEANNRAKMLVYLLENGLLK